MNTFTTASRKTNERWYRDCVRLFSRCTIHLAALLQVKEKMKVSPVCTYDDNVGSLIDMETMKMTVTNTIKYEMVHTLPNMLYKVCCKLPVLLNW